MRLLLTTDAIGGVWAFAKELTSELLARGHSVALVSLGHLPSNSQRAWCSAIASRYGSRFRFDASAVPLEWMDANDSAYTAAEPLLLRVADEFAPDLLHSSQFCFGRLPVSIPKVLTAHSDVLSWADACRPHGLPRTPWFEQYCDLVQRGLEAADAVVAPTRWMASALERHFFFARSCSVILNGRTVPSARSVAGRKRRAIFVGRLWDEAKNVALLSQIRSPFPIAVAGDESLAREHPRRRRTGVEHLGRLQEDDLLAQFRSSSIYLAASIYEPFGLAPLEAALCGCAIVANDIPSLREVWGGAALYFSGAASLEENLRMLDSDASKLHEARRRSELRALQLSASCMADAYLRLYRALSRGSADAAGSELPAPQPVEEMATHGS